MKKRARVIDDVAVQRAVLGDPPAGMTLADRRDAVRILTARGSSSNAIAETLRVTQRTVTRARRALGLVPRVCTHCAAGSCRWHPRAAS